MILNLTGAPQQVSAFERWLVLLLLLIGLVLSSFGGILVSYSALMVAILAMPRLIRRSGRQSYLIDTMGMLFAGCFLLLAMTFAMSASAPEDMRYALNFLSFILYIPLAAILGRAAGPQAVRLVAWLAFSGAVLGAAYAIGEVALTGARRAGSFRLLTDPIRLANTTLFLGFLALIGLRHQAGRLRHLLLTGPLFGLAAVIACGARNAMIAFAIMLFWAILSLIKGWKWRLLGGLALIGALVLVINTDAIHSVRLASLISTIEQILSGQEITDLSMAVRIELYRAAMVAFGDAPIFGHGWNGMMEAIAPHLPPTYTKYASLPHLHNEVLNFALASGSIGVLVLVSLLAAPLILAVRSPADSQKDARILGCSLLVVGYITMGLADTMLSYETHTALYVLWSAILLAYCRDDPALVRQSRDKAA